MNRLRAVALLGLLCLPALPAAARSTPVADLVRAELRRCPAATALDIYKMLYQAALGVRHMLEQPDAARQYLREEMAALAARDGALLEPISPDGTVVRVNMAAFKARGLDEERLFAAICASARTFRARPRHLARWWGEVTRLTEAGELPLERAEVRRIAAEIKAGGAAPHHSAPYESACAPHYRVVQRAVFKRLFPAAAE